uniref:Uncharacterized protein n=1 Tax=Physcomitrium patens TaxID=3218 RepID=A0A7I4EA13_PHYPA
MRSRLPLTLFHSFTVEDACLSEANSLDRCTALMNMPTRPQHAGSLWIRDAIFPGLCFLHTKPIGSLTHSIRKLRQSCGGTAACPGVEAYKMGECHISIDRKFARVVPKSNKAAIAVAAAVDD